MTTTKEAVSYTQLALVAFALAVDIYINIDQVGARALFEALHHNSNADVYKRQVIGRVVAIKDDTFVLETGADRVKIRFTKTAISAVEKLNMDKADKK